MTTTFDTSNLTRACAALATMAGVERNRAIDYEAVKVLEAAVRFTPAAKAAKIRDSVERRPFTTLDGKRYKLSHRYPDALWRRLEAQKKQGLQRKLRARGLSKQSWQRVADAIGLRVSASGLVVKALASDGKSHPENFRATRLRAGARYGLTFENAQPTVQSRFVRGRAALRRAIAGRVKYFERNLRLGVLTDIREIARAYKGLLIR